MRLPHLLLAALLGGTGCGDVDEPIAEPPPVSGEAQVDLSAQIESMFAEVCDVLPPDGPCAHACDEAALAEWVPVGTCALFLCHLTDGRAVAVHACRPDD